MTDLSVYLLKASVINAIILAFYYFTLKNSYKFRLMRAVLLSSMIMSLLLPLIPINKVFLASSKTTFPTLVINLPIHVSEIKPAGFLSNLTLSDISELMYYVVTLVFLTGMLISVASIIIKRMKSDKHTTEFGNVLLEKSIYSPFSFFSWVFMAHKYLHHPQLHLLLKHEFTHVKEMHSIDRIISAIFRTSLWFSPFAHITANQLIDVHEYQADDCVVREHSTRSEYSDLILSFYLSPLTTRGITNNFSFHIKKRILMINNLNTARVNLTRVMIGLCLSLLFITLTAMVRTGSFLPQQQIVQSAIAMPLPGDTVFPAPDLTAWITEIDKKSPEGYEGNSLISFWVEPDGSLSDTRIIESAGAVLDNFAIDMIKKITYWQPATINGNTVRFKVDIPFEFTADGNAKVKLLKGGAIFNDPIKSDQKQEKDREPLYPGGDKARIEFITANTPYPEDARKARIEGTVYVQFIIQSTGKVTDTKIIKGVSSSIDKVALEAVSKMPDWSPAKKDNKPVSYEMVIPIKFSLSDNKESRLNDKHSGNTFSKETTPVVKNKDGKRVFTIVEEIPEFPGGDDARSEYIKNNLKYPEAAFKEGIEGTVYITFIVEPDGSITDAKVLRGVGGGLDEVALKIIENMPKWKPGKMSGEPVPVQFNIPIKFKL